MSRHPHSTPFNIHGGERLTTPEMVAKLGHHDPAETNPPSLDVLAFGFHINPRGQRVRGIYGDTGVNDEALSGPDNQDDSKGRTLRTAFASLSQLATTDWLDELLADTYATIRDVGREIDTITNHQQILVIQQRQITRQLAQSQSRHTQLQQDGTIAADLTQTIHDCDTMLDYLDPGEITVTMDVRNQAEIQLAQLSQKLLNQGLSLDSLPAHIQKAQTSIQNLEAELAKLNDQTQDLATKQAALQNQLDHWQTALQTLEDPALRAKIADGEITRADIIHAMPETVRHAMVKDTVQKAASLQTKHNFTNTAVTKTTNFASRQLSKAYNHASETYHNAFDWIRSGGQSVLNFTHHLAEKAGLTRPVMLGHAFDNANALTRQISSPNTPDIAHQTAHNTPTLALNR